ncbi:MAG: hypothetical protein QOD06_2330 [Candidatus Binatota bacterium]|nr:hypothetical protein [Candidatus Binatota bacterium]
MAWGFRLRATSFAVTMALTLWEAVVLGVPLGLVLWLAGAGSPRAIAAGVVATGGAWALGISTYGHARPPYAPLPNDGTRKKETP